MRRLWCNLSQDPKKGVEEHKEKQYVARPASVTATGPIPPITEEYLCLNQTSHRSVNYQAGRGFGKVPFILRLLLLHVGRSQASLCTSRPQSFVQHG